MIQNKLKLNTKQVAANICYGLNKEFLILSEDYDVRWRFALYVAIIHSYLGKEEELDYKNNYKQWGVDHRLRGLKKLSNTDWIYSTTTGRTDHEVNILVVTNNNEKIEILLNLNSFPKGLYSNGYGPCGETILKNQEEIGSILSALIPETLNNLKRVDDPRLFSEEEGTTQVDTIFNSNQQEKLRVYYDTIIHAHEFYHKQDENGKSFIATLFGAGLFYLPHGIGNWNRKISVACLIDQIQGKGRKVKDHIFPRKKAALDLLNNDKLSFEEFIKFYKEKVAPFIFLTPTENTLLINYYHVFDDYEQALNQFQITTFPTGDDLFESNKQLNNFINYCFEKGTREISIIDLKKLERWYNEFINSNL